MSDRKYNTLTRAKVTLRKAFLKDLKENPTILDVFAGVGEMWDLAYNRTRRYTGFDSDRTIPTRGREVHFGDSQDLLRICEISKYNVYDLDAFANPWSEFDILLSKKPQVGSVVFLTESLGRCIGAGNKPPIYSEFAPSVIKRNSFRQNRTGVFRHILFEKLKQNGFRAGNLVLFEKTKQPRTIYAGFILEHIV